MLASAVVPICDGNPPSRPPGRLALDTENCVLRAEERIADQCPDEVPSHVRSSRRAIFVYTTVDHNQRISLEALDQSKRSNVLLSIHLSFKWFGCNLRHLPECIPRVGSGTTPYTCMLLKSVRFCAFDAGPSQLQGSQGHNFPRILSTKLKFDATLGTA